MNAVFRAANQSIAGRGLLVALLLAVLTACSTGAQDHLPAAGGSGSGAILGSVVTESYRVASMSAGGFSTLAGPGTGPEASPAEKPASLPMSSEAPSVPGQLLVQYRDQGERFAPLAAGAGSLRTELVELGPDEDPEAAARRLALSPDVALVSPNYYVFPTGSAADPYLPEQWALPATGLPSVWPAVPMGGEPVVVAVLDTGFDLTHEDLEGRFLPGHDFCADATCTAGDSDPGHGSATNWHGTHVAGVIAAIGGNGIGVHGVADTAAVKILPVKIFNDDGGASNTDVLIRGMRWAAGLPVAGAPLNPHPARIINLSLAGDFSSSVVQGAIDEVRAAGVLVVASTGNAGIDRVMSPAAAAGVLGVGASNSRFARSCFSNYGTGPNGPGGVDLLAPGGEANGSVVGCGIDAYGTEAIVSAIPGDEYGRAVGTSMAAPMVSGLAALLLAAEPHLTPAELEERLLQAAYFDAGYMDPVQYGAGVLRADRALGFVGPGDTVEVELLDEERGHTVATTVTLTLEGSSSSFSFAGQEPGGYELTARDPRSGRILGEERFRLDHGQKFETSLLLSARR